MALRDPGLLDATLTLDERFVLDDFVRRLKEHYGDRLERAAVFGSRARGDVGIDSDIDVLIVLHIAAATEGPEERVVWDLLTAARTRGMGHVPISPAVFSIERFVELRDRERRFALDADREGIRL